MNWGGHMRSAFVTSSLVILLVILPSVLVAQPPDMLWTRAYGEEYGYDYGNQAVQTMDGGFVLLASINIVQDFDQQIALIKYDADGNELWVQEFGETDEDDFATGFLETADGGFVIIGESNYDPGKYTRLIRTDANGNEEWSQILGDNQQDGNDAGYWIEPTDDGGYIITGITDSANMKKTSGWSKPIRWAM